MSIIRIILGIILWLVVMCILSYLIVVALIVLLVCGSVVWCEGISMFLGFGIGLILVLGVILVYNIVGYGVKKITGQSVED